jgi:hypothetical protein
VLIANLVTDEGIKHLAKSCRNLKKVSLPASASLELGDQGLLYLLSSCRGLTHLETSGDGVTEASFVAMVSHPDWVPNLKKLRLRDKSSSKTWMRGMRELGKTRPKLPIELVSYSSSKKWDSWFLHTCHITYVNGRKVGSRMETIS